jgi:hypothetical protein|nr:hypothetical protein [Neorhizobium tomejilense]
MEIEFDLPVAFGATPHNRKTNSTMVGTVPVTLDLAECGRNELDEVATVYFHGDLQPPTSYFHRSGSLFVKHAPLVDLPRTFSPYDKKAGYLFEKADRSIRLTVDNAIYHKSRGTVHPKSAAVARLTNKPLPLVPVSELKFTDPNEEAIHRQVDRLRERCDRLLVCDGMVYLKVSEPVIGVDLVVRDGAPSAWIRPVWRSSRGISIDPKRSIPPHAAFRLDDEDGLAFFLGNAGLRDSRPANWVSRGVQVDDPTRLMLDSVETTVFSAAARIVRKAQPEWLGDHPVIDDIFDIVKSGATDTDYPARLGDLLGEALEVHHGGVRVFSNEMDVIATEFVRDMWDTRSISVPLPVFR